MADNKIHYMYRVYSLQISGNFLCPNMYHKCAPPRLGHQSDRVEQPLQLLAYNSQLPFVMDGHASVDLQ